MISTVKKEITIQNELLSKIKWACTFSNCEPKIKNGNLRKLEKFNVAYVEPHKVEIKDKTSFTESSRKFIGILNIFGVKYLTYHISEKHTEKYIRSIIFDLQKERCV